jgi:hypothetical protein
MVVLESPRARRNDINLTLCQLSLPLSPFDEMQVSYRRHGSAIFTSYQSGVMLGDAIEHMSLECLISLTTTDSHSDCAGMPRQLSQLATVQCCLFETSLAPFNGPTLIEPNAEWALFRNDRHSSVAVDPMSRIVQDQPLSVRCTVQYSLLFMRIRHLLCLTTGSMH